MSNRTCVPVPMGKVMTSAGVKCSGEIPFGHEWGGQKYVSSLFFIVLFPVRIVPLCCKQRDRSFGNTIEPHKILDSHLLRSSVCSPCTYSLSVVCESRCVSVARTHVGILLQPGEESAPAVIEYRVTACLWSD